MKKRGEEAEISTFIGFSALPPLPFIISSSFRIEKAIERRLAVFINFKYILWQLGSPHFSRMRTQFIRIILTQDVCKINRSVHSNGPGKHSSNRPK
jgi:hypothetical protein